MYLGLRAGPPCLILAVVGTPPSPSSDRGAAQAQLLRELWEASPEGMLLVDVGGKVVMANAAAEAAFGYGRGELLGLEVEQLMPGRFRAPHRERRASYALVPRPRTSAAGLDLVGLRKDGSEFPADILLGPVPRTAAGGALSLATVRDASERKAAEDELRYLADHDALTGLWGRRHFEAALAEQWDRARRYGEPSVVMVVDIDGFKEVNDRYGHLVGDQVLTGIADALGRRLRATDTLARIGGDELGVVLPYAGAAQAATVASDLATTVSGVEVRGAPGLALSVSVGTALVGPGTPSGADALMAADRAMYLQKAAHKGH